ncbi:hypothetical protein [Arthrobacter castelli]|uniref:hypothetical protein n=1 Tax=Arthrobacter castelli TaxID=271431 RepID=UPI0004173F32|nr:hypothetical protein [Arthrobacter castelli]
MTGIPDREPRMDTYATERVGKPREDLSGLAVRQPYRSAGPWLSPDALELLGMLGPRAVVGVSPDGSELVTKRGGLGMFEKGGNAAALEELKRSELANDDGKLTSAGLLCTQPLRETLGAWRITARLGGRQSLLQLWTGADGDALVLAGPSGHEHVMADPAQGQFSGHAQMDYIRAGEAAGVVTSWLGIGPSWFHQEPPFALESHVYDARLQDRMAPPPAPAPGPAELWEHPWLGWQVEGEDGASVTFINAGSAGQYLVHAEYGKAVFERVPARNVYRHLATMFLGAGVAPG